MSNALHPVMAAALAPFMPTKRATPTQTFYYVLSGVQLECEVEWEAEEKGSWDEPGYPPNAILWTAKVGGVDIAEILSDEQRDEIEIAFLEQDEDV